MKLEKARDKLIQEFQWYKIWHKIDLKGHKSFEDIKNEAIENLNYLIRPNSNQHDWIISKHFVAFKMHDYLHLSFYVAETTIDVIDDEFIPIRELSKI